MARRDIIAIGGSAGGREAIVEIARMLPPDFPGSVFVVWHMPPTGMGVLPKWIGHASPLPVHSAEDGQAIKPGHIYVAPLDHHLLVGVGRVRVTKGPKENRFRPAIDPLFRSAAYAYGPRVIGVVLSGALNDGTSGLWAIKDRGGVAIVQDPDDALVSSMPLSAIENVHVDYQVPVSEIADLLVRLVADPVEAMANGPVSRSGNKLDLEVKIAREGLTSEKAIQELGEISEFTCPECQGSLWQMREGNILRFRCRTGHAYTADALLEDMSEAVEASYWAAIRGTEETVALMRHMAEHLRTHGDSELAQRYDEQAAQAHKRSNNLRQVVIQEKTIASQPLSKNGPDGDEVN